MSWSNPAQPFVALLTATLLAASTLQAQTTWYVDDDAPNDPGPGDPLVSDPNEDGSAEHPFDAIQEGIDAADPNDTVLVLDGTYTGQGNKNLDFGARAITVRSQSGPEYCIIDCELAGRGVYFHSGETAASILEGLTITNGYLETENGGGVYCYQSSPTINSCVISNNAIPGTGFCGGGLVCVDGSDPAICNCVIANNAAWADGGGIYCHASSPTIANCTITGNSAAVGAGVSCRDNSDATITQCTITGNTSGYDGAAVMCYQSNPTITLCIITQNTAILGGGAVQFNLSNATIVECSIMGNYGGFYDGGGISCYQESNPLVANCVITGNEGYFYGGGVGCSLHSSPTIVNCTIAENMAYIGGGVGCTDNCCPLIINCAIAQNTGGFGGGIGCRFDSDPAITNCAITGNVAYNASNLGTGGGVHCAMGSVPTIANCTIAGNVSDRPGGGVYCEVGGSIVNSILRNDAPDEIAGDLALPSVSYCDVQGGWPGPGNIDADPLFVDPDGPDDDPNTWEDNDHRLSAGSPCIDAGCNCGVPPDTADLDDDGDTDEFTPLDLDGEGRFFDDPNTPDTGCGWAPIVDMGAYEYGGTGPQPCFGDLDNDRDVDLADLSTLLTNYGSTSGMTNAEGDLDCDGDVDLSDLQALLSVYGTTCP
jgi:hypothetical protein